LEQHEYITAVSGCIGPYKMETVLKTLRLETNKRTWGPYGATPKRLDKHFHLPAFGGQIVGFYGRCGECMDAIGVYVQVQLLLPHLVDHLNY
jgi:Jacalin-like lectin domain